MSSEEKSESPMLSNESLETLLADRTFTETETTCVEDKTQGWRVEWTSDYPKFSPCTPCRKCGSVFNDTKYQRQCMPDEERRVVVLTERNERVCDRCHFVWYEAVKEVG